jgi:class 3 adenylate cyclase
LTDAQHTDPDRRVQFLQLALQDGQAARLRFGTTFIGRGDGNDIVLDGDLVSRRHAKVIVTDVGATVHDLDSHNGIFLNGEKVRSARVEEGDLLYFGNICTRVDPADDDGASFDPGVFNESSLVRDAMAGRRDDPSARNLGTLYRAIHLLHAPAGTDFSGELLQLCLELTRADSAILISVDDDGALETPVVLGNRGEDGISWAVVRKSIADGVSLFSRDLASQPLVKDEVLGGGDAIGAVMCVPVIDAREKAIGAIWAATVTADECFGSRELETLTTLAHLLAARWEGGELPESTSVSGNDSTDEAGANTKSGPTDLEFTALNERIAVLESELARKTADTREQAQQIARMKQANDELTRGVEQAGQASARAAAAEAKIEALNMEIAAKNGDLAAAQGALAQARAQGGEQAAALGKQVEELNKQLGEAKVGASAASRWQEAAGRALPTWAFERVRAQIAGTRIDQALERVDGIAMVLGVSGVDAVVAQVPPQEAGRILDQHREAIEDSLAPLGAEVVQTFGHHHLVVISPEQAVAGVTAALAISQRMTGLIRPVAALHAGPMLRGFFGDPQGIGLATIGEPVIGANGISDLASPGAVVISKEVRDLVGDGPRYVSLGLHSVRGVAAPLDLFQVASMEAAG